MWQQIGSKRGWSCALAIIVWMSGFQLGLYAQQTTKLTPKVLAMVSTPPLEVKDGDPPLLQRMCLARLEWSSACELGHKAGGPLGAGGG